MLSRISKPVSAIIDSSSVTFRLRIEGAISTSTASLTRTRQVNTGAGEGNQNDLTLHFGLGQFSGTVQLEVFWPDGTKQWLQAQPDQTIDITYDSTSPGSQ